MNNIVESLFKNGSISANMVSFSLGKSNYSSEGVSWTQMANVTVGVYDSSKSVFWLDTSSMPKSWSVGVSEVKLGDSSIASNSANQVIIDPSV